MPRLPRLPRQRRLLAAATIVLALGLPGCAPSSTPAPSNAGTPIRVTAPTPSATTPAPSPPARPIRLRLGGHSSPVVPVGVDALHQLQIPSDISTLGWWSGGAKPGSQHGFVVITGHSTQEGTGAANRWWTVKPGSSVKLKTRNGWAAYRVVSRHTYIKPAVPLARWFPAHGPHGKPGLALITCSDYSSGEWRANTVVEAVPA